MVDNESNDNERLPLLGAIGETPETSTTSSTKQDVKNNSDNLINFSTQNVDGRSFISCKVCGYQIDITDKTDTFVVKCLKCNEATPIKRAPAKKRYVRCSCNCLLICCETANKIVCPRTNCKKIIDLPIKKRRIEDEIPTRLPTQSNNSPQPSEDDLNVNLNCGYCSHRFAFNILSNRLAVCPSCKKKSSVGNYANIRSLIFFILFAVTMTITIIIAVKRSSPLETSLSILLSLITCLFLSRFIYFFRLKVSEISTPSYSNNFSA